jgi:hypothetical protein
VEGTADMVRLSVEKRGAGEGEGIVGDEGLIRRAHR